MGPVRNLRFTQSYLDALAGVEAVAGNGDCLRGLPGRTLVPAVRLVVVLVHRRDGGRVGRDRAQREAEATMGISDRTTADLTLYAEPDGSISVDTGSRFVAVEGEDLERILDRLAADGGTLRLLGGTAGPTTGMRRPSSRATRRWGPRAGCSSWPTPRGLEVIRGES